MEEDKIEIDALEDYANISKSLNKTVIEISPDKEEEPMYITTTSRLQKQQEEAQNC